ncbi:NAD(P)-dependent oxidoreductase [Streptomyces sp. NPDC059142]|uniref:NAD(P)-dependent oxidoreductase n=1 Tax=Streptomyces sp. NPDC059142 TaxID=3346739 RepID=UPI0036A83AF6
MHLTVLGASGATGQQLIQQALDRGHTVTAVARDPDRLPATGHDDRLIRVRADVRDTEALGRALEGATTIVSALGNPSRGQVGVLTAGARGAVAAAPERIIWMGAFGTGTSAAAAGALTRTLLRALGAELTDKVSADTTVLDAGGTVFHCGPLSAGPLSERRRTVDLGQAPHRLFPARVSRATVAAAMLDAAETPDLPGGTYVPLDR